MMQSLLNRHFLKFGTFYPIGGASEIALNIIPVMENTGGKVLATKESVDILAPIIISRAVLYI